MSKTTTEYKYALLLHRKNSDNILLEKVSLEGEDLWTFPTVEDTYSTEVEVALTRQIKNLLQKQGAPVSNIELEYKNLAIVNPGKGCYYELISVQCDIDYHNLGAKYQTVLMNSLIDLPDSETLAVKVAPLTKSLVTRMVKLFMREAFVKQAPEWTERLREFKKIA